MTAQEIIKGLFNAAEQDFWVAERFKLRNGELAWKKWQLASEWLTGVPLINDLGNTIQINPNYRTALKNEIVLESDLSKEENDVLAERIMNILKEKGISFIAYFSGNKSTHIHIFFDNVLEELEDDQRTFAKKEWARQTLGEELYTILDESLFGKKHMILIKDCKHPKTGRLKKEIARFLAPQGEINSFIKEIAAEAAKQKSYAPSSKQIICVPLSCPAVSFALANKFSDGSERYMKLAPNVAAITRNHPQREDLRKSYYVTQFDANKRSLESWDASNSVFRCEQLQGFMKERGQGKICDLCLLGVKE